VIDHDLSLVPKEARPYQGTVAGIFTRTVANTIDGFVVGAAVIGGYIGFVAVLFVIAPRDFEAPDLSVAWFGIAYFDLLVVYFTACWWLSGRTLGDHVMGIRVITGKRRRLRFIRSFLRALLCVVFPVGLLWCVVGPRRRSVQDLLLHTSVIYDWLPRPTPVEHSLEPAADASGSLDDADPDRAGDGADEEQHDGDLPVSSPTAQTTDQPARGSGDGPHAAGAGSG
jgi:uncharacterized RDD family membrane protein YckC